MQYVEYGKQNRDVIVLLHGGGLSWWNFRQAAEYLSTDYRVVLPVLHGHGDSDMPFTGLGDNAAEILHFLDETCGGHVLAIGGVSLGGQVLTEILAQRPDVCNAAILESVSVLPSRWMAAMIGPSVSSCFGLIQKKWFARLQFRYLRIPEALFEAYYADTCRLKKRDMIAFLQASLLHDLPDALKNTTAKVRIVIGEREQPGIKRSAQMLCRALPGSCLDVKSGLYHGEYAMCHAEAYAEDLRRILERN